MTCETVPGSIPSSIWLWTRALAASILFAMITAFFVRRSRIFRASRVEALHVIQPFCSMSLIALLLVERVVEKQSLMSDWYVGTPRESLCAISMMIRALAPEMSGIALPRACSVMWPITLKAKISGGNPELRHHGRDRGLRCLRAYGAALPVFCSVLVFHFMRISGSLRLHQA